MECRDEHGFKGRSSGRDRSADHRDHRSLFAAACAASHTSSASHASSASHTGAHSKLQPSPRALPGCSQPARLGHTERLEPCAAGNGDISGAEVFFAEASIHAANWCGYGRRNKAVFAFGGDHSGWNLHRTRNAGCCPAHSCRSFGSCGCQASFCSGFCSGGYRACSYSDWSAECNGARYILARSIRAGCILASGKSATTSHRGRLGQATGKPGNPHSRQRGLLGAGPELPGHERGPDEEVGGAAGGKAVEFSTLCRP